MFLAQLIILRLGILRNILMNIFTYNIIHATIGHT